MTECHICPVCGGSGEVLENLYTHINSSTGINFVNCQSCNAKGYLIITEGETG